MTFPICPAQGIDTVVTAHSPCGNTEDRDVEGNGLRVDIQMLAQGYFMNRSDHYRDVQALNCQLVLYMADFKHADNFQESPVDAIRCWIYGILYQHM